MRRLATEERFLYLPVSRRDRRWELYVTGTGHIVHAQPNDPNDSHPLPYYYLWENGRVLPEFTVLYIPQGEGEFESEETGLRSIQAGTVMLVFPRIWHRYRPKAEIGWTQYWMSFGGKYPECLMRRRLISPDHPVLDTGTSDNLLRPYLTLQEWVELETPGLQQLAASNVLQILGSALAAKRNQEHGEELNVMIRQAKKTIVQHVEELVDMKELARSLGLSYNYFRNVFKQQTGMAPYQYHMQLRINRAKELLHGTEMSTKEVAFALQFESPYHFSRIFKQKTGMTPTAWRKGENKGDRRAY